MKIYKIAKTRRFKDFEGKTFYVHHEQPCFKCGKMSREDFTYDINYVCEECGGNFLDEDDRSERRRTDTPVSTMYPNPNQDNWNGSWDDAVKVNEGANQTQWYKTASEEQLDFFKEPTTREEPAPEVVPEVEEGENEGEEDNGIRFLSSVDFDNAHFVQFRINDDLWAYRLSFPEDVQKVKQIARRSHGKAFDYAKKRRKESFKVTEDWPRPGSIIREEI